MSNHVLQKKAMLVTLHIRAPGNSRLDKNVTDTANRHYQASDDAGKYSKQLLDRSVLKPIRDIDTATRKYHYANTSPWLDDGTRLLASKHYLEYTKAMRDFRNQRDAAITEFMTNYPDHINEAKQRLGNMYNPDEYLTPADIQAKFSFEVNVRPVPQAEDFRVDIADGELNRIREEIAEENNKAQQLIMKDLWQRLHIAVERIVETLNDPDKIFRNSMMSNLVDLVKLLPKLNITDDPTLEAMRREIEDKLCSVEIYHLREVPEVRAETAAEAAKIMERMAGYMGATVN